MVDAGETDDATDLSRIATNATLLAADVAADASITFAATLGAENGDCDNGVKPSMMRTWIAV
jgi:hypothetical protein